MAVRLDAATDRLLWTGSGLPNPASATGFTASLWALIAVDTNINQTMLRLSASGSTTATLATAPDGLGGPGYYTGGGSIESGLGWGTTGVWRKVAYTCASNSARVYAATPTGATVMVTGAVSGAASPTMLCVGGRSDTDTNEWFNGRLACVRLWSTVLTQTEIEAEWNSFDPVRTANLWGDWPLLTATDLADHSGNGRNLSAGSTAVTTEADPPIPPADTGAFFALF